MTDDELAERRGRANGLLRDFVGVTPRKRRRWDGNDALRAWRGLPPADDLDPDTIPDRFADPDDAA